MVLDERDGLVEVPLTKPFRVGLVWTEGTSLFDIVACSFEATPDITAPTVSLTAPASGATVSGWDVEHHEVELVLERGVVQDVQARVRRTHLAQPEEATR